MISVFFDTWAFLALANAADAGHEAAQEADDWVHEEQLVVVTSDYVLDETITGLHAHAGPRPAFEFLELVEAQTESGEMVVLPINAQRRPGAIRWFRRLAPDTPRLSFTDCTSFSLLEELRIAVAFTADRHFSKVKGVHRLIQRDKDRLVFRRPVGY